MTLSIEYVPLSSIPPSDRHPEDYVYTECKHCVVGDVSVEIQEMNESRAEVIVECDACPVAYESVYPRRMLWPRLVVRK